jgi:hypothetical protein
MDLSKIEKNYWSPSESDIKHINEKEFSSNLDEIARKYNADKGLYHEMSNRFKNAMGLGWPDSKQIILPGHNYVELYERYLGGLRDKEFNLLEIGMGNYPTNGYSMRMWLEYFPKAHIDIVDINENNFKCDFEYDTTRVTFYKVDQSNNSNLEDFCKKCNKKYDIIIDDGSHIASHQINTFEILFKNLLNNCGIYIVEDLFDNIDETNISKNLILHLAKHAMNIQSNCLISQIGGNRNTLDISSIHFYRAIVFIMKNTYKITQ